MTEDRNAWHLCTLCAFRNQGGRMSPWWGSDGHGGRERFYTCDTCGRTT